MKLFSTFFNSTFPIIEKEEFQDTISLVQEIHSTFSNEMGEIIKEVNIKHSLEQIKEELERKSNELKSIGFINSPEVLEVNKLMQENDVKIKQNKIKDEIMEGILYFQQKYPLYKVITFDSLDKICKKYQLGYAAIRYFEKSVPQKNIDALLLSKIAIEDKAILRNDSYSSDKISDETRERAERNLEFFTSSSGYYKQNYPIDKLVYSPLIIAAPPADFVERIRNNKVFGKLVPIKDLKDPIVMQPVEYKNHLLALIITAWGPEASDPDVVNQIMN